MISDSDDDDDIPMVKITVLNFVNLFSPLQMINNYSQLKSE